MADNRCVSGELILPRKTAVRIAAGGENTHTHTDAHTFCILLEAFQRRQKWDTKGLRRQERDRSSDDGHHGTTTRLRSKTLNHIISHRERYTTHKKKVRDNWLSGEIYGTCKNFTLQWYERRL